MTINFESRVAEIFRKHKIPRNEIVGKRMLMLALFILISPRKYSAHNHPQVHRFYSGHYNHPNPPKTSCIPLAHILNYLNPHQTVNTLIEIPKMCVHSASNWINCRYVMTRSSNRYHTISHLKWINKWRGMN